MSVTTTARLALNQWSAGGDPVTRAQANADNLSLENNAAMDAQGTLSGRPSVGKRGRFYWATDSSRLFRDDGTSWNEIATLNAQTFVAKQSIVLAAAGVALNLNDTAGGGTDSLNLAAIGAASGVILSGAEYDGTNSTARASSAAQFEFLNNTFNWFANTGLTSGSTYTRAKRMSLDGNGVLSFPSTTLARTGQIQLPFGTGLAIFTGLASESARIGSVSAGTLQLLENAYYDGAAWQRDTTSYGSARLEMDVTGSFRYYTAGAASGAIGWGQVFEVSSTGSISANGITHQFGGGAVDGTGAFFKINDDGTNVYLSTQNVTNGNLSLQSKGTGEIQLQPNGGAVNVLRVAASGSTPKLGFFGTAPQTQPTITNSRGGNAALTSLLGWLASLGLIIDGTTA